MTLVNAGIINIILMTAEVSLTMIMVDASSRFRRAPGDFEKQGQYKRRILWCIVVMALIALGAATMNLFFV